MSSKRTISDFFAPSAKIRPSEPSCSTSTASPDLSASKAKNDVIIPIAYDIGKYVAGAKLSDKERLEMIETDWIAPTGFEWPNTTRIDRGKERRKFLGQNHFSGQYSCFAYSQTHQGIYCKICVLFAPNQVHGQELGNLVKQPLKKFVHLTGTTGKLDMHLRNGFHESCVTAAILFKKSVETNNDAAAQLNRQEADERAKNRKALLRIIQAIECHGLLGLPLQEPSCSASTASPDLSASKAKDDVIIPIAYDIGKYVAGAKLWDKERLEMIETDWIAPPGFEWPSTTRMDRGKERRKFLGQNHFSVSNIGSQEFEPFLFSMTYPKWSPNKFMII
ncbi:hypothetical protein CAPTEDRAFT_188931 [Capitella teleta]|uniref:Uncharacterized protein n=1 Tax=Capitella teleta TaxID=283909 RepID=R7UAI0_CAPTE|nr:hypothetical protein CAPTEDRAFT_188931 [Capitella teleta]|eukprot:ELU00823.1 hypothetical protein CAPTEDRAFT_188931 [Capitella teleta]